MYPDLFGIKNFSYSCCITFAIVVALIISIFFFKKNKLSKEGLTDLLICACFAVLVGLIFSVLFENLYELIEKGSSYKWTWAMTFYGGLIGGSISFIVTYLILRKSKVNFKLSDALLVAPLSITSAHSIGRIGCFLAGCCYGRETDSWIGLPCAYDLPNVKVIPTQLIEALFLLILFLVLLFLTIKKRNFKINVLVYMASYSIFRFIIEFFRNDPRGVSFFFSPSQVISLLIIISLCPIYLLLKRLTKNEQE